MPSSIDARIRSRESPAEPARAFMVAVWEAIRRSALERGRDVLQRRRRFVEQDGHDQPLSNSDDQLRFAEPQFEEPSDLALQGKVKWFNPSKGYGFVELLDGSGDAFLHVTVLGRIGISVVQPGETLELRVAPGQRGPQVTEVISVDTSTAAAVPRRAAYPPANRHFADPVASVEEACTVKWFNARKGFVFIMRESGGKDAFV